MQRIEAWPGAWRAAADRIVSGRAAWSRTRELVAGGVEVATLAEMAEAGLIERWDIPRRRASRPPIEVWTLTPLGAAQAEVMIDERPYSERHFWTESVEDLEALGPILIAAGRFEVPLPRPELLPDVREAQRPEPDEPPDRTPAQATDPVTGDPWVLFAQKFPVMRERPKPPRRKSTKKPSSSSAKKVRKARPMRRAG